MSKVGLDNFQRASYLYQLAWAAMRTRPDRPAASHHYSHMLVEFGQKAVLRMEPDLKRTVCAACHVLLVPGATCTVRTRSRPQRCQVWRCRACGQCRRFPCPRPTDRRQRRKMVREAQTAAQGTVRETRTAAEGTPGRPAGVVVNASAKKADGAAEKAMNGAEKAMNGAEKAMNGGKKTTQTATR